MGASSTFAFTAADVSGSASPSYTSQTSTSNVANLASGEQTGMITTGSGLNARVEVDIAFDAAVPGARGWLDYVRIAQECELKLAGPQLNFYAESAQSIGMGAYQLEQAPNVKAVWDVTEGNQPQQLSLDQTGSSSVWQSPLDTTRRFAVFSNFGFPEPEFAGPADNFDLHQIERADLVIATRVEYMEAAQRLAKVHADEGLEVAVVTQRAIFDEFASGSVDPTALKMFMMMLRDRCK